MDEDLLERMAFARQVVALGHSARNSRNVKLRQPLARALAHLEAGPDSLDEELVALIQDELNVKEIVFVEDVSELVTYRLLPDNQVLGPRFKERFPAVRQALAALEPLVAVKRLRARLPLQLELAPSEAQGGEKEKVELAPDEVLVREEAREGLEVIFVNSLVEAVDHILCPASPSEPE